MIRLDVKVKTGRGSIFAMHFERLHPADEELGLARRTASGTVISLANAHAVLGHPGDPLRLSYDPEHEKIRMKRSPKS